MTRSYRRWYRREWKLGRLSGEVDLGNLNHPWIQLGGEGDDWAWVAVGFGTTGIDPVAHVELSLTGTRAGRAVCEVLYRWRTWRWRG